MSRMKLVSILGIATLALLTGCVAPDERTSNQGGSSPTQAMAKLASDRIDTLNPDDIQVLADLATQQAGVDIPEVTDDQAAAVVDFLAENGIATTEDLVALIHAVEEDPDSIVIPDELWLAFTGHTKPQS